MGFRWVFDFGFGVWVYNNGFLIPLGCQRGIFRPNLDRSFLEERIGKNHKR